MSTSEKQILTHLTIADFNILQTNNPGLLLLKFGATWCRPCQTVDHIIDAYFKYAPTNVLCAKLDIDDNMELYGYLKKRRVLNGIPVVLCYEIGNTEVMPTDSVTGASEREIALFFQRCNVLTQKIYR